MRLRSHYERRKKQRIPTSTGLWASCKHADRRTTLRVQDISVCGAWLVTEEAIPVDTRLELLFSVPEGQIRVLAVVCSFLQGRDIGVEFVSMESGTLDLILKLVKRLLSSSTPVSNT